MQWFRDFADGLKGVIEDGEWPLLLLLLLLVPLSALAVLWYACPRSWKWGRSRRLRRYARASGLEYQARSKRLDYPPFRVFKWIRRAKTRNVMTGELFGHRLQVFDHEIWIPGNSERGRPDQYYAQTLCLARVHVDGLPDFQLCSQTLAAEGDVNFVSFPEFSLQYVLIGSDESRIRQLFNREVLTYFTERPGLCVECDGQNMALYHWNRTIHADEFPDFMQMVSVVILLLARAADASATGGRAAPDKGHG